MDTLVMSSGSFAFTAAYSFVGDTAVYMPSGEEGECRFRDFQHECVKEACPGQVSAARWPSDDRTSPAIGRNAYEDVLAVFHVVLCPQNLRGASVPAQI